MGEDEGEIEGGRQDGDCKCEAVPALHCYCGPPHGKLARHPVFRLCNKTTEPHAAHVYTHLFVPVMILIGIIYELSIISWYV